MNEITAENNEAPAASEETKVPQEPSQSPLEKELDRVEKKGKYSREERLLFEKSKIEDQLRELGGSTEDDDAPVTVGMLKAKEKEAVEKTALQLADDIEDETERKLVKHYLSENIRAGTPQESIRLARAVVNSLKNSQIAQEVTRKQEAQRHSSGSGAPAKQEDTSELTPEEEVFARPPYNLSKEKIIAARKRE